MKKIFKNKKSFILILFFILSLSITSKIEAWGYVQDLNNNYWVDTGDKKSCEGRVLNDSLSSTKKCEEYNPKNSPNDFYYFNETQSDGTKKTHSFLGINLCILARNNLIKETPIMLQGKISECAVLDLNNNPDVYTFDPKEESSTNTNSKVYNLLAPIGGLETAPDNIGDYFNTMFEIIIGICAVLAVIMIVLGGIQYMGNESVFGKTEAKSQIWRAILGLLIALASFALLNTIDPNLLGRGGLNIKQVSAEIEGDTDAPVNFEASGAMQPKSAGIICDKTGGFSVLPNVVKSFSGRMTYQMGAKGSAGPGGTIKYDCSGFVNAALKCSGINKSTINGGTATIFSGGKAEKVTSLTNTTINGIALQVGDLVGWKAEGGESFGHVMIYIGGGQVADSHGGVAGKKQGGAYGQFSLEKYKSRIKYIVRTSKL